MLIKGQTLEPLEPTLEPLTEHHSSLSLCVVPADGSVFHQRGQHAVEHAELFVGGVTAGDEGAEASHRVWSPFWGKEKLRVVEGLLESGEEDVGFFASRGEIRAGDGSGFKWAALPPFPAEEQHRLGEVQRREVRIGRKMDEAVSARQSFIVETRGFGTKEDGGFRRWSGLDDFTDRFAKVETGYSEAALASRSGEDALAIANRVVDVVVEFRVIEDVVCIGCRRAGTFIGPAVARSDQSQLVEPAIEHGAGAHADVFAELGFDEDDDGWGCDGGGHIWSRCVTAP